jgi:two-component system cell cycle response regulator
MAKTKRSMIFQRVQQKVDELERAIGKKLTASDSGAVLVTKPAPPPVQLLPGWSYVIREERPERSFAIYSDLLSKGARGLCISRSHPDVLRQKYGFKGEAIWLTKTETAQPPPQSKDIEYVSPNNLARLASSVRDFLSKGENGTVIVEGLEYLTTQNDFKSVLKFVQLINEQVVLDKGYLLMPVDGSTMDPKEFSLVEREMSQVL